MSGLLMCDLILVKEYLFNWQAKKEKWVKKKNTHKRHKQFGRQKEKQGIIINGKLINDIKY